MHPSPREHVLMPQWVLSCPQCHKIFTHSKINPRSFLFLCPLHPIMDYKICFTLNNVNELHRCRAKTSQVLLSRDSASLKVQEHFQYPAPISSSWLCISKSLRTRDSYLTNILVPSRLTNSHKPWAHPVAFEGLNAVVMSAVPGAARSSSFIHSSSARL